MTHLLLDGGDADVVVCTQCDLGCYHTGADVALLMVAEGCGIGKMTFIGCSCDVDGAIGTMIDAEQVMTCLDGIEQTECLAMADVEVVAELMNAPEDITTARRPRLDGYGQRNKAPPQSVVTGQLEELQRHIDVRLHNDYRGILKHCRRSVKGGLALFVLRCKVTFFFEFSKFLKLFFTQKTIFFNDNLSRISEVHSASKMGFRDLRKRVWPEKCTI